MRLDVTWRGGDHAPEYDRATLATWLGRLGSGESALATWPWRLAHSSRLINFTTICHEE